MKFFHLSDLHIGVRLFNRDLLADQSHIFDQIVSYAAQERPDAVVIAGDLYDKAIPSAEAVAVFDRLVSDLAAAVPQAALMLISGNHDSASRINVFRSVLQQHKIHMIGLPPQLPEERIQTVTLRDEYGPVHFYLLPFVKPSMVRMIVGTAADGSSLSYDETLHRLIEREAVDPDARNVLVSHQFYLPAGADADSVERMDSEVVTVGNIDAVCGDVLARFDYAALGHIHKPMRVGGDRFRYCGTPMACSVSEAGQQKGVVMVELGAKGDVRTRVLPLTPQHAVRVLRGTLEEVLGQACEDYVTVILTDKADLDVIDMQDRLRHAFPNLLETRRETVRRADYGQAQAAQTALDPYALCCSFLKDLDAQEKALLQDVVNTVGEEAAQA